MCKSVTVSSLRAFQHAPSAWANFVHKMTSTLTVTENKNIGTTHVAYLRHLLTSPLERHAQLSINRLSTRGQGDQLSAHLAPGHQNQRTARFCPSMRKTFQVACTMLTSVIMLTVASSSAASTTMQSSTPNFMLATNLFVKTSAPSVVLDCPRCCYCCRLLSGTATR